MRTLPIFVTFYLLTLISFGQDIESNLVKIRLSYQDTFGSLPELYEIRVTERKVDFISPITQIPSGSIEIKTKKFNRKKWSTVVALIDALDFESLESSTSQGVDGAWYTLHLEYSDSEEKNYKIWSGYAPEALSNLHQKLKNSD